MPEIDLLGDVTAESQTNFYLNIYGGFVSDALYGMLFEGLDLRGIESRYLGKEFNGHFAKAVLNSMGVNTSIGSAARGMYAGEDRLEVAKRLLASDDLRERNIGDALMRHRPRNRSRPDPSRAGTTGGPASHRDEAPDGRAAPAYNENV